MCVRACVRACVCVCGGVGGCVCVCAGECMKNGTREDACRTRGQWLEAVLSA